MRQCTRAPCPTLSCASLLCAYMWSIHCSFLGYLSSTTWIRHLCQDSFHDSLGLDMPSVLPGPFCHGMALHLPYETEVIRYYTLLSKASKLQKRGDRMPAYMENSRCAGKRRKQVMSLTCLNPPVMFQSYITTKCRGQTWLMRPCRIESTHLVNPTSLSASLLFHKGSLTS